MIWLIDTNICAAFLRGTDSAVRDRLFGHSARDVRLCSVIKAELLFGARKSERVDANLKRLAAFFEPIESLPFDDAAAS